MIIWQKILVAFYGFFSLAVFAKGLYESSKKRNTYGETPALAWMGIFVWADAVIFGFFWFLVSLISLIANDWILFWFIGSVFWVVRSFGETIYWFNQQFSTVNRRPPEILRGYKFFKDDSIWFVYQIIWQCISVFSIIAMIYLTRLWLTH
jgi:hypothetical protein